MPLIEDGRPAEDSWTSVPDGEPVPGDIPAIISFERWQAERDSFAGRNTKLGVRVRSATLAPAIAADLDRFALVAVEFPKFRDGRGFSTARELRERYGYEGEIRAVGHVLPDQYLFLKPPASPRSKLRKAPTWNAGPMRLAKSASCISRASAMTIPTL